MTPLRQTGQACGGIGKDDPPDTAAAVAAGGPARLGFEPDAGHAAVRAVGYCQQCPGGVTWFSPRFPAAITWRVALLAASGVISPRQAGIHSAARTRPVRGSMHATRPPSVASYVAPPP